jgi:hypothetical protein
MLTITYDLSIGKGNFSAGSTSIISNFYSDYGVSGSSTRISSYDSGTRTASWVSIGTDGYGSSGKKLTITNSLTSGSTIILNLTLYSDKPFALASMTVNKGTSQTLFTAALASNNIPGTPPTAYSIYPRLTGLDTTKNYGIVLRSPATIDDSSTNNKYGFAYSDSNPYANGFERLSTNGGSTWTTESSGNRDLMFTIYK